jgi:hypothetical protein
MYNSVVGLALVALAQGPEVLFLCFFLKKILFKFIFIFF